MKLRLTRAHRALLAVALAFFTTTIVNVASAAKMRRIVCVGDSLHEGVGSLLATACGLYQQSHDRQGFASSNLGVGGQECSAMVTRVTTEVVGRGYDVMWLACGTNDLAAGRTVDQIWTQMRTMVLAAQAAGLVVYLSTVMPRKDGPVYTTDLQTRLDALNARIRAAPSSSDSFLGLPGVRVIEDEVCVRDPVDPLKLRATYADIPATDDWLHLGPVGQAARVACINVAYPAGL